jgi:tetratricopeptide (TPR) repeat protein
MKVLIFEEHASVLAEWWRKQIRGRTLVYLDAHLDLQYINRQRLASVEQCMTAEAVRQLEKPHHLLPDCHFSYSLEDFLYPAHRLGLIKRLIWVAPPHVETAYSQAVLEQLQQMDGVSFEELVGFRKADGGWFEGSLLGLDITICNFRQLERMTLPVDSLIDIDSDYFVTVPGDVAWVNPRQVFEVLNQLPVQPAWVTLSRSVSSGYMPLRYRFFVDYLAALWEHRQRDAAHYERLFRLDQRLQSGQHEEVNAACHTELERYPDCAATYYLLSLSVPDAAQAKQYQHQAAKRCASYRPDVLRSACEIPSRRLAVRSSTLQALERRLSEIQASPQQRALTQAALGLIYCAGGKLRHAVQHYQQCAQHLGAHPELALEIGKLLLQTRQFEAATPFLREALRDDKTRAAAHLFLAQTYGEQGLLGEALHHLDAAHDLAPAWGQILALLAAVHRQLGNQQQSQALQQQYQRQQLALTRLVQRFGD